MTRVSPISFTPVYISYCGRLNVFLPTGISHSWCQDRRLGPHVLGLPFGVNAYTGLSVLTWGVNLSSLTFHHWTGLHQLPHFPLVNVSRGTAWFCPLVRGLLSMLLQCILLSTNLTILFLVFLSYLHDTQGHLYMCCCDMYATHHVYRHFAFFSISFEYFPYSISWLWCLL